MKLAGHHEFSAAQCPMGETEAGNSNTNRGLQDTHYSEFSRNVHTVQLLHDRQTQFLNLLKKVVLISNYL